MRSGPEILGGEVRRAKGGRLHERGRERSARLRELRDERKSTHIKLEDSLEFNIYRHILPSPVDHSNDVGSVFEISLPNLKLALLPLDSPRRSTGSIWDLVNGDDSFVGEDRFGGVVLQFSGEKRKEKVSFDDDATRKEKDRRVGS